MQKFSVVKEKPTLVRDESNQAILNTDNSSLIAYKKRKAHAKTVETSLQDINNMKQDINDLKTLMQRILDKIG
jgi:hypothetical protein